MARILLGIFNLSILVICLGKLEVDAGFRRILPDRFNFDELSIAEIENEKVRE